MTKQQKEIVENLVEDSKNDRTTIVGSDIRWLAMIIRKQEKDITKLRDALRNLIYSDCCPAGKALDEARDLMSE